MDLATEYYIRNEVRSPLIRYAPQGHLIVCNHQSRNIIDKWEVVSISFLSKDGIPGTFHVSRLAPKHNGYTNFRSNMTCLGDSQVCWDEYEDYIYSLVATYKGYKAIAVTDNVDLELACWEMLLYNCDYALSELPTDYIELIYDSMNCNLHKVERIEFVKSFISRTDANLNCNLVNSIKIFHTSWSQMRGYIASYSFWLAKLLNG